MASFFAIAALVGGIIATGLAGLTGLPRIGIVAASILLLIGGALLLGRAAVRTWRPVRSIIGAAGRLSDGDYSARASLSGSAGLRAVGGSFNEMARRLEEAEEQRRRLMSDLGHELRTPLSIIRGELEAVIDGVREGGPDHAASLLDEVEVLERLIEDIRLLSLSEAGRLELQLQPTDLADVVREIADSYVPAAAAAGVDLVVDAPDSLSPVEVDPVRYRQALTNLLTNSLAATPHGGRVTISMATEPGRVVTSVSDTGSGIDPHRVDTVFERFEKSPGSEGSGLGLSIARSLIEAHGGELTIPATSPAGTIATMWVPG